MAPEKITILIIAPYPPYRSPSQRYRFEHYLNFLQEQNIGYNYQPFIKEKGWNIIHKQGHFFKKMMYVFLGFCRRWLILLQLRKFKIVFVHREAAPLGPPVFEWMIARVFKKKIIYDFDDAIWIPAIAKTNQIAFKLKCFGKIKKICSYAHTVTVGNEYLANFAKQYSQNVIIIPTVVDTKNVHNKVKAHVNGICTIGWTGTFSTLVYLQSILPLLIDLEKKIAFNFLVIADKDPELPLKNYQFVKWSSKTESEDLLKMDIGIMPLPDDEWSKGKCGFKAIQYMSLGIPAVVANVGVNATIVDDGINGYVCNSNKEWEEKLLILLNNVSLRTEMGKNARTKIENCYSVSATKNIFIETLKKAF